MKKAVFFLVYVVPICFAENGFVFFKSIPLGQGHQCAINDVLFTRSLNTLIQCVFGCSTHPMCKQIFYEQGQAICMGCSSLDMQLSDTLTVTENYVIEECAASESPCENDDSCANHSCTGTGEIDECANNPCQHGGTCIDGVHSYSCTCVDGYVGTNCETETDDCALNPCLNGGTCTDGEASYICTCVYGYEGAHCETGFQEALLTGYTINVDPTSFYADVKLTCQYQGTLDVQGYKWWRNDGFDASLIGAFAYDPESDYDPESACTAESQLNATLYQYSCPERNVISLTILGVTVYNNGDEWTCAFILPDNPEETSNVYSILV